MRRSPAPRIMPVDLNDPSLACYFPLWYPAEDMTGLAIKSYDKNRHTGTVNGAAWGTTGRIFTGTEDISIPDHASLSITDTLTIIARIILSAAPDNDATGIVKKADANEGYGLAINNSRTVYGYFGTGAGWIVTPTSAALTVGDQYHLCITYNREHFKLYVNHAEVSPPGTVEASAIDPSATALTIGSLNPSAGFYFKGVIGDVFIYNRVLTLAEITDNDDATKWRYK